VESGAQMHHTLASRHLERRAETHNRQGLLELFVEYVTIRNGGVGEGLKPAVLKNEIGDSLSN
jgi:hypothetical protein